MPRANSAPGDVSTSGARTFGPTSGSVGLLPPRLRGLGAAWRARDLLTSVALFAAGAIASVALYAASAHEACFREQQAFERRAARLAGSMEAAFAVPLEILHSIPALFQASGSVERHEFAEFTRNALERAPDIYALEWFPSVDAEQRGALVRQARADGLLDFDFRQLDGRGRLVPAFHRREYLPLFYMAPPNAMAMGFDLSADAERVAPAYRARDIGRAVSSPRLRLVEDPENVHSVAFFAPVYEATRPPDTLGERRAQFRGVAAVVFRIAPLMQRSLGEAAPESTRIALVDEQGPEELRILFESPGTFLKDLGGATAFPDRPQTWDASLLSPLPERLLWSRSFRVADRPWRVLMASPLQAPWGDHLATLLGGLALSAVMAGAFFGSRVLARLRLQMRAALRLGQYTVTRELGRGAMGVVYEAQHALLRRRTALKLLDTVDDSVRLKRFEREAQLTSQLTHPNTISVYDYGATPDGRLYYAMEFIEGMTFEALVAKAGPLPPARVVQLLVQVCGALEEAHEVGLIHRDIKPANLMLTCRGTLPDFVKVLDFGLVKSNRAAQEPAAPLTQSRSVMGTPHYLCPEGLMDGHIDARGDLYSLGAVAYFLLTGTQVFLRSTVLAVCADHISSVPEAPSARLGRSLPADLEALVLRCLAKTPGDRPPSARALGEAFLACGLDDRWTAQDARSWWRQYGPESTPRAPTAFPSTAPAEQTVMVDCRDRIDPMRRRG